MCPTTSSANGGPTPQHPNADRGQVNGALCQQSSQQYQLIQKIRRRYNQEAAADGSRSAEDEEAVTELVTTVAAGAKLLSTELYTKPAHFVLELLQNADDCSYAAGVQPRVLLVVMPDAILHATNEVGFRAADVEAICALARSTKSRKVGAFTGEKGIGFKATAVASEVTYISSSGCTFAFDMRPGAYSVPCLGLVCPRWEEGLQSHMHDWLECRLAQHGAGVTAGTLLEGFSTRIWMQLKPDLDRDKLLHELSLLDPYMLLNLRQLKDVAVLMVQPDGVQLKQMRRVDTDESHISISVQQGPPGSLMTTTTRHLLCMRRILQVPAGVAAGEEKRQGVEQVEVVFALPVAEDGTPSPDPHAQVFAFLPVRSYGFRFHMQADFVLPSSREGILESRPWNLWLQQELPAAFLNLAMQAVRVYQQQQQQQVVVAAAGDCSSGQPALSPTALMQYLPLREDVQDEFVGRVSTAILQGFSTHPCVLTASGALSMSADTLLPEPLMLTAAGDGGPQQQQQQQQLISNEWLQQGLRGVQFVSDELLTGPEGDRTAQVLLQLGSRRFTATLLLSWLCSERTAQLLRGLTPQARAAWLPELYSVCMRLKSQPAGALMALAADAATQKQLSTAPILQLYGSSECVSMQQLATSGRQVHLWDSSMGDEADLQLLASQAGGAASTTRQQQGLSFVDPSTLGPDGAAFVRLFLGVQQVPLSLLVQRILQLQEKSCNFSDAQQDQLLLFLLRNAGRLSTQDLQLLQGGLHLSTAAAGGTAGGGNSSSSRRTYTLAKQLHVPSAHAMGMPSVSRATLANPALQQDFAAAGLAFTSEHYMRLGAALRNGSSGSAAGPSIWQLLCSFGLQELTVDSAVRQLLTLYSRGGQALAGPMQLVDHQRHLQFLSEAVRNNPVCLQLVKQGLRLFSMQQQQQQLGTAAAAAVPASSPDSLWWPMVNTAGADAVTDQLCQLGGVQLVHPGYVLTQSAGSSLVKSITAQLTPGEVWRQLVQLHAGQDLEQAASTLGLSLQELLLQQVTYLAGVRLELQGLAPTQQQQQRSGGRSGAQLQGLLLLSNQGQLVPSCKLHLPPREPAVQELLQELQEAGGGLQLLHPCFEPCVQDPNSEQALLLTTTLGVCRADKAAVVGALVKLHRQGSAALSEQQRAKHLAYLSQHTAFLQQQPPLLQAVQETVLLLDACGQHRRAGVLHMPLGPQFAELEADMCAAGMLFLHSSYTAETASGGPARSRQLQELLDVLGVQVSDVDSIAQHILKLYSTKGAQRPNQEQHMLHMRFLMERWPDMSEDFKQQLDLSTQLDLCTSLPVLIADTATVRAASSSSSSSGGGNGTGATSAAGQASSSGSKGCVYRTDPVYLLPAADRPLAPLLWALRLGGAQFLAPAYEAVDGVVLWLQARRRVITLNSTVAAQLLLKAHGSGSVASWQQNFSPADMAQHALHVALCSDRAAVRNITQKLLLAAHATCPAGSSPQVLYRRAQGQPMYFPVKAQSGSWALQEVLLPGRVVYLHPAYAQLLSELQQQDPHAHSLLQQFLSVQMKVHLRPIPGSVSLQEAISTADCWRPLLLLLHDEWSYYTAGEQQQLRQQLEHLEVATTCGPNLLQECFLPRSSIDPGLVQLMAQLQLPFLQLPDPASRGWDFLQSLGVSMELKWPTLHKVLQQLSSAGVRPPLANMQQLYKSIAALEALSQVAAADLRAAFESEALLFVPGRQPGSGSWHSSDEVAWQPGVGVRKLFPHIRFISVHYRDWQPFFCNTLHIRDAELDDLRESLRHFARKPPEHCADLVRACYDLLAKHAAELEWLHDLLSNEPVLLVQQGSSLAFSSAGSSSSSSSGSSEDPIYLPDSSELIELFGKEVTTLAVSPEKLPALQPLLSCIRPPLPSLAASVRRSFAAADAGAQQQGRQLEPLLAQQLQQALRLYVRYLYKEQTELFMSLYASRGFLQLDRMPVFRLAGLAETLQLGSISKTMPTQAAVQWQQQQEQEDEEEQGADSDDDSSNSSSGSSMQPVLLLDEVACTKPRDLLHHIVSTYVDLLLRPANSSSSSGQMHGAKVWLRTILRAVQQGDVQTAVSDLEHEHMHALPAEYDPWAQPDASAAAADDSEEDSSEDGAGEEDGQQGTPWQPSPAASAAAIAAAAAAAFPSLLRQAPAEAAPAAAAQQEAPGGSPDAGPNAESDAVQQLAGQLERMNLPKSQSSQANARAADKPSFVFGATPSVTGDGHTPRSVRRAHRRSSTTGSDAGRPPAAEVADNGTSQQQQQQQQRQQLQQQEEALNDAAEAVAEEPVPPGVRQSWLEGALEAAQAAVTSGPSLEALCQASQQQQPVRRYSTMAIPESSFADLPRSFPPADQPAGGNNAADDGYDVAAAAAPAAAAGDAQPTSSSGQGGGSAAGPAAQPGSSSSSRLEEQELLQKIGDVGEAFVFRRLSLELPGFDEACWRTGARQQLGLPGLAPDAVEPPYDFVYTDSTGKLSGRPAGEPTRCFIEVKATQADLSSRRHPKPFEVSRRQWELARRLHNAPSQGVFVVVRVERVGRGPRIAAVLRDPVQLLTAGQLWVSPQEKLLFEDYPIAGLD